MLVIDLIVSISVKNVDSEGLEKAVEEHPDDQGHADEGVADVGSGEAWLFLGRVH